MIAVAVAACEIGFWLLLLGGLTVRYLLRRTRLGGVLLACVPILDVVLLVVTAIDLARGGRADWTYGLAAVYLGFSAVFGPAWVRGADRRFAQRFDAGAAPARPRRSAIGDPLAVQWRLWRRCVLASGVACGALGLLVVVASDADRSQALWAGGGWFAQIGALCLAWLVLGPLWTLAASQAARHTHRSERGTRHEQTQ
jgi:hypothetical protein